MGNEPKKVGDFLRGIVREVGVKRSRDAFATAFFGQREPHLNELWAMSENAA